MQHALEATRATILYHWAMYVLNGVVAVYSNEID